MDKTIPFPSVVTVCVELVPVALVTFALPDPFGAMVISPFEPSVRVIVPAFVPELVSNIRS